MKDMQAVGLAQDREEWKHICKQCLTDDSADTQCGIFWLLPTLDFRIPARVDVSSTAKVISRDTADFVMAHNTRATDRVSPSLTVGVEGPSGDQGDLTRHSQFCTPSETQDS